MHLNNGAVDNIPAITSVDVLKPVYAERFALKLTFENGECRKYVLPIDAGFEQDEVVSYKSHVFTDKIWRTAHIANSFEPNRGKVIEFSNEFFISVLKCYVEGEKYSQPKLCNEIIYEDEYIKLTCLWKWNVDSIREDEETGLLTAYYAKDDFNICYSAILVSPEGKRLSDANFDYIDDFYEGLAEARRRDKWFLVDKTGKETPDLQKNAASQYQDAGERSEGMCKVSLLKMDEMDLAYHSDNSPGIWGFINEDGVEVIKPQYIYADNFCNGIALVCKGEWTIDKKWDNRYNTGKYWTEEELWGAIDKEGNEVIPFIFDEIHLFYNVDDVFFAHYGGWETGHWGVIDNKGNWLAEPIFEDIAYEFCDGMFAFYKEDRWSDDEVPLGIYDIKQQKVIFEPQFLDVSFMENGWISVEVFDESLGHKIEKIIDRQGNEKFKSIYTLIFPRIKYYEVMICDENGDKKGVIDENGNVILPCEYDFDWGEVNIEKKLLVFNSGESQGVKDFEGNIRIPPIYNSIYGLRNLLLTVRIREENHCTTGLVSNEGCVIIPPDNEEIRWCTDNHIICRRAGCYQMLKFEDKRRN